MIRCALLALATLAFSACDTSRSLTVFLRDDGTIRLTLDGANGTSFGSLRATLNGVDLGPSQYDAGSPGKLFDQAASPATATFTIAAADRPPGPDASFVVTEDGARYTMDAPGLLAPRAISLGDDTPSTFVAGSTLDVRWSAPRDQILVTAGFDDCLDLDAPQRSGGAVRMPLPTDLRGAWGCTLPPPGTVVETGLYLQVEPVLDVRCGGVSTCQSDLALSAARIPVAIEL